LDSPGKKKRARFLFFLCGFHFLDDGFADSIYLLLPFIAIEFHLSFSQVGLLKGIFSGTMSVFQLPMSFLGEKVGELAVIAGGLLGLACGFLFLSMSSGFPAIVFSLIFAKGTAAGQHPLGSSVLSRVFEASGRRAAMGTYNFSGDVGKVCIPFVMAVAINLWGWRHSVMLMAAVGAIAVCAIWGGWASKHKTAPSPLRPGQETRRNGGRWGIDDRKRFSFLAAIGILDLAVRNTLLTFLPFLLLIKGIPSTELGYALTLLFAGGAAGKFVCGVVAERFGIVPMVAGTEALTGAGILSLLWAPPAVLWVLLPLVGMMLNGTSSVLYATVAEIISPAGRSRGYGLYYAVTQSSGALSPVIFGFMTDSLSLHFTVVCIALMAFATLPLSQFLSRSRKACSPGAE
jgi:FSR family fosmidomycin resistance protein-like MFS transporter